MSIIDLPVEAVRFPAEYEHSLIPALKCETLQGEGIFEWLILVSQLLVSCNSETQKFFEFRCEAK